MKAKDLKKAIELVLQLDENAEVLVESDIGFSTKKSFLVIPEKKLPKYQNCFRIGNKELWLRW